MMRILAVSAACGLGMFSSVVYLSLMNTAL